MALISLINLNFSRLNHHFISLYSWLNLHSKAVFFPFDVASQPPRMDFDRDGSRVLAGEEHRSDGKCLDFG